MQSILLEIEGPPLRRMLSMSRTSSFVRKMVARRNSREFERALANASPSMQQELRAMAARQQYRDL